MDTATSMEESTDVDDHHRQKEYILTFDLGHKVQQLSSIGLKVPSPQDPFFQEIRAEITHRFAQYFPNAVIKAMGMHELSANIMAQAIHQQQSLKKSFVATTCLEIAGLKHGYPLDVNRVISSNGKIVGIGPRPGSPSIADQIKMLASISENQSVILVEDGAFTGTTVSFILEELQRHKVEVAAVVIGFAFPGTVKKIQSVFNGEVIIVEEIKADFIDWMPDHDFFLFAPNCGRVLGLKWNGQAVPFYGHRGESYAVPYLQGFCDMSAWTNIPAEHCGSFSLFCVQQSLAFWQHIEAINSADLRIGDLLGVYPRINIPCGVGDHSFPSLDSYVIHYLSETCHMLV